MSLETIKTVEDLSLNAWPSHQMQVYDGWILRFSYFYTHRTNCVETIGPAQLPLPEKVAYCEEVYEKWRTPCVFKISPLTTPALELYLAERGYEEQHRVDNMVLDLASFGDAPLPDPAAAENGKSPEAAVPHEAVRGEDPRDGDAEPFRRIQDLVRAVARAVEPDRARLPGQLVPEAGRKITHGRRRSAWRCSRGCPPAPRPSGSGGRSAPAPPSC